MSSKNDFGGVTITDNHGALGIGSDQTITNVTSSIDELTLNLLKELNSAPIDLSRKKDLEEAIAEISKQVKSKNPNKITLSGILTTASSVITIIKDSPALIEAFSRWKSVIESFIN